MSDYPEVLFLAAVGALLVLGMAAGLVSGLAAIIIFTPSFLLTVVGLLQDP